MAAERVDTVLTAPYRLVKEELATTRPESRLSANVEFKADSASAAVSLSCGVAVRWAHLLSVVRHMDKLTEDAVREIEQIHSSWIEFEVAGDGQSMLALCADEIELWPPDEQPVRGRAAVSST